MQARRLQQGGLINRDKPIFFEFNGQRLSGYEGDTVASALLANNIHLVARSLKYHRPRGIISAGLEEPSALLSCSDRYGVLITNLKAPEILLKPNLKVHSQNCWPNVSFDVGAVLQIGSSILSAGFYYKTFKWPKTWWFGLYEKVIRNAAGHGKVSKSRDSNRYDKRFFDCDTVVIGSGPQGISAAIESARSGKQVLLIEQDQALGGSALWQNPDDGLAPDHAQLTKTLSELSAIPNLEIKLNTLAFGQYDHGLLLAVEKLETKIESISWNVRARKIIMATGAIERPLVFPNNDRPGIMLASAVRHYIYRYAVQPGSKAFLAINDTTERSATASALTQAGIEVVGCLDDDESIVDIRGNQHITQVLMQQRDGSQRTLKCDLMCVSAGWTPTAHLAAQIGDKSVIEKNYIHLANNPKNHIGKGKAFIDFQNDVTRDDIALALREGYDHIELTKRYTTTGMGTDQGKTSWPNAIVEMATIVDKPAQEIGTTTFRPPYSPVSFGVLVGAERYQQMTPTRHTPFYNAFKKAGCVFQTSGDWIYSRYFPKPGETMHQSIHREVLATRSQLGCVDMSTLGKVDVKGKDALEFLNRIYCNNINSIKPGRLRYVLMLREDGILFDDGTVAQLGEDHFLVTITTANSSSCWLWMQKLLQVQWSDLDVQITSVTDHWASLAIAGPESIKLLNDLCPDFATDAASFPFASVREGWLNSKMPCRVFSVSFSGEMSFEINVPAAYAGALFEQVLASGEKYNITPYGLETLDVLRIEKGHLSVGTEIDGRTTPADLGLERMISIKKDFIGRALLQRPALQQSNRPQLVGLIAVDGKSSIPPGALITESAWQEGIIQISIGKLTAAIDSPTLQYSIALALLDDGFSRIGHKLWVVSPIENLSVQVLVTGSCFYDNDGSRLNV